jgi:hypothetical protein
MDGTPDDRDAALRKWLEDHDLVGEFARAGRSAATFSMFWHRHYTGPGFDPPVPDWFREYPGEDQGERALERMQVPRAAIDEAKARRTRRRG